MSPTGRKKVLCLDLALRKTGLVVMEGGKMVEHRTITVPAKVRYHEALLVWYDTYKTLFKELEPDELVVENRLERGWSGNSLASIEGARVACLLAFSRMDDVYLYSPDEVKYFLTGKRNASKNAVRGAVIERIPNVSHFSEDEIDALALYLLHSSS